MTSWSDVLVPGALTSFLEKLKLQQHGVKLVELGFDDVDDFAKYGDSEIVSFQTECEKAGIPAGHVLKLVRAVRACRPLEPLIVPPPQPVVPSAASGFVLPAVPSVGSSLLPPAITVQATAHAVGNAAAALVSDAHTAKVLAFLDDAEKLNPGAPRLIYGRGHSGPLVCAAHSKRT